MNPISNPNQVFSHDAEKYVYQQPDMRMVNPSQLTIKPFKVKSPDKSEKTKPKEKKKEEEGKKKKSHGFFDLFNPE